MFQRKIIAVVDFRETTGSVTDASMVTPVRDSNGELMIGEGQPVRDQQLRRLSQRGIPGVVLEREEEHWVYREEGDTPGILRDPVLSETLGPWIKERDIRGLPEGLVEFVDRVRDRKTSLPSDELLDLLKRVKNHQQSYRELQQTWGPEEGSDRSRPFAALLERVRRGEDPGFETLPVTPTVNTSLYQHAVSFCRRQIQLYDDFAAIYEDWDSDGGAADTVIDLSPEHISDVYEHIRNEPPRRAENATAVSGINTSAVEPLLEAPAYDTGDPVMEEVVTRSKQVMENFLLRGVYMNRQTHRLLERIEEVLVDPNTLYNRLTFPVRDRHYLLSHSVNVLMLALFLGRELGMDSEQRDRLGRAGLFFDTGMLRVDPKHWIVPSQPEPEVVRRIQKHPDYSVEFMNRVSLSFSDETLWAIRDHHERLDGSGYPRGKSDEEIGLPARILAVADVYNAMSTARPYRPAIPPDHVMRYLVTQTEKFDQRVVQVLQETFGFYPAGTVVQLNTDEIGVVEDITSDGAPRSVRLLINPQGGIYSDPETILLDETTDRTIAESMGGRNTPNVLLDFVT